MPCKVKIDERALKEIARIDRESQKRIMSFLKERIEPAESVHMHGKPLAGTMSGLWRYRVGNYRLICLADETKKEITVLKVGHRKEIYR